VSDGEAIEAQELFRENQNLPEQRRAIGVVLRAVARSEGLQPVLDEIVEAAKLLCQGEHSQLYLVEGDVLAIFGGAATPWKGYALQSHSFPDTEPMLRGDRSRKPSTMREANLPPRLRIR
jgi:hypothetical protein